MPNPYQNALDSQSAPNFYALVQSFARDLKTIREGSDVKGNIAAHPVAVLYMTQLYHLLVNVGGDQMENYSKAHDACLLGALELPEAPDVKPT